ncbi:MAG: dipeptidase [Lachnospiraceae bacterium]|nr:dipeptidase [Lachnospiraceae bacterium]
MRIIDLHCDTIMHFYEGKHLNGMENTHINLEKLKKGEWMCQCFAIYVPWNPPGKPSRHPAPEADPKVYFEKAYAAYLREMELNKDEILPAYSVADMDRNYADGKISSMLTVEDSVTLDGRLEEIDRWYDLGVRMASLTWNHENSLGYPQSMNPEEHAKGLKPFGIEAVRRMNELGIAVDVSHLSEGGFWDVVNTTSKPFIASHSCARALMDSSRDLTDEQLRALGNKGGVVGVNYLAGFLHPVVDWKKDNYTSIDDIARHLRHMINVAGIDAVALGSDYDGMGSRLEWGDAGGQQLLVQGLEKSFRPDEIEKICYKNAQRVFRDIFGE